MKSGKYTVNKVTKGTTGSLTERLWQDEGKAQMCRGSRCLVLMTVCLGLICVLLLVFITLYIIITAERDLLKNTVEEFNHTINNLQDNYTDLMTEKDQLKNNFNSLSQTKLELVNDLTAQKSQLRGSFNALNQMKLELETRVNDLTAEKSQLKGSFDALNQTKLELETRVNDLTAEKSQLKGSFDSFNQTKLELETRVNDLTVEKSQLQKSFNSLNQTKLELETELGRISTQDPCYNYTVLDNPWRSINNKVNSSSSSSHKYDSVSWSGWYRLFINSTSAHIPDTCVARYSCGTYIPLWIRGGHPTVTDGVVTRDVCGYSYNYCCSFGSYPIKVKACPGDYYVYELVRPTHYPSAYCADTGSINTSSTTVTPVTISPGKDRFFISSEWLSWSGSRQFCRDRGADLVIINTEEKQRFISSFVKERVWIGLSDIETEGIMKWVDNSTLKQGFWYEEEPNNAGEGEDCVELMPSDSIPNWNDLPCSLKRKAVCEKWGF
ncbi:pancreatic secretory granule membrane major glycoprotein GP2-like [Pimephales promelas]|nr:pancreatic secretory granule membrane major glycoprotein GP2-like [Pimephales promelas]